MKRQKDLFDLFRDNQHKLNEMPSPQAWRRLERRLDSRRRFPRHDRQRWRPLMMAAALLLLAVITFLFSLVLENRRPAYLAANTEAPLPMEDLTFTDVDRSMLRAVEFTRKYQDRLSNPIEEGSPDRRLVPSDDVRDAIRRNPRAPLSSRPEEALLTNFYWLLGEWVSETNGRQSVERWMLSDNRTLQGAGLLLQGKDTLFRENMSLRLIDNRVYLFVALDDSRQPVRYELLEQKDNRAVFENKTIAFPQQIVLENSPTDGYTVVMQNSHPAQMTRAQSEFIGRRNQLFNQRAVRKMRRVR